ncbi:MAG: hypothetical protein AUJ72_01605 [Candidatus Omnitrophica bacterium CG1_02_46_14]|nr:MAG: hypothetical protein AUJ72_01605 [Candidatus Omnitrophica bacterium CG1_02_46_14]
MNELEIPKPVKAVRWYFEKRFVFLMLFIFGPLALPLVWLSPKFSTQWKIVTTALAVILTVFLIKTTVQMFTFLTERLKEIQDASSI